MAERITEEHQLLGGKPPACISSLPKEPPRQSSRGARPNKQAHNRKEGSSIMSAMCNRSRTPKAAVASPAKGMTMNTIVRMLIISFFFTAAWPSPSYFGT
ncbi:hypothetical protein BDW72DRAFT_197007 [Aspergillus terricola var. indicus]